MMVCFCFCAFLFLLSSDPPRSLGVLLNSGLFFDFEEQAEKNRDLVEAENRGMTVELQKTTGQPNATVSTTPSDNRT
jgi:hypothetical protein